MASASSVPTVKSAERTLDIVEYVVSRGRPLVAREIADALTIPVSSLSYLLTTLVDRGYLVRNGRSYSGGPGLQRLQPRERALTLTEVVAPLIRTLCLELNETASFFVRRGWEIEALVTETSEHALRYAVRTGATAPLHCLSGGKALLAHLDEDDLVRYFAEAERKRFTPTTIVTEAELRSEIADIRMTGIARTAEEHTPGIRGFARVAMIDGKVVGAVSVGIPVVRSDADVERRVIKLLSRTTNLLGRT